MIVFPGAVCGGRRSRAIPLILALWVVSGCGEEVALSVGNVAFETADLLGLSDEQENLLAMIAIVGLATAREEVAQVGAPVIDRRRNDLRIDRLRQELALEGAGVTDEALRARYEQSPDFELTVRHLLILSERWRAAGERAEARARAEVALARALAGEAFPELAGEVSEEPGAEARGGLLEPGREGSWVDEFWRAASSLEVGDVNGVVESEYGFHVIRLDGREAIPFREARPGLVAEVAAELSTPEASGGGSAALWSLGRDDLLTEAERRGLTIDAADEALALREWEFRVSGWTGAFGFEAGIPPGEIRERALLALGSTDQNARIARSEVIEFREVLLAAYPVVDAGP